MTEQASSAAPGGTPSGNQPGGYSGRFSGLHVEVEPCPEARRGDVFRTAAVGGLVTWGGTMLLGASPVLRLLGAGIGAAVGALASRYHVYLDWDPDRLRGAPQPKDPPAPR